MASQKGSEQSVQNLVKRAVAGSFLFRYPDGDEKKAQVALFRRSGDVRTYQRKLAPISGSVEKDDANPLATALREIKEETGLDPTALEPLRVGKPYSFVDEAIGREWTINPFGFRLKDKSERGGVGEEGIVIDWEHAGWEWHDPLKVGRSTAFDGVPRLVDSLRRVWPEYDLGAQAGEALTTGLRKLRDDHKSGARQLAEKSLRILRDVIAGMDAPTIDQKGWDDIRMAAWHLCKNGRESMGAAITSALYATLDSIESVLKQDLAPPTKMGHIFSAIDGQIKHRQASTVQIRKNLTKYLEDTLRESFGRRRTLSVLTLSSSSTISESMLEVASALGVSLDIRILESRPNCEGVKLAQKLLELAATQKGDPQLRVTIYTDASAALAVAEGGHHVDLVLLGADRISSSADVSNKTGSLPAVLSARHSAPGSRVVVLSEVDKIAGPGTAEEHVVENNDPLEVTNAWDRMEPQGSGSSVARHELVTVKNIYFEWVPANLIDAYITDQGSWSAKDVAARSKWIEEQTERFFGGL